MAGSLSWSSNDRIKMEQTRGGLTLLWYLYPLEAGTFTMAVLEQKFTLRNKE